MSNQEGFSIGNSFSAFSFVPQNGLTPILDPRTDSPVSNNNNTRKSPRPSASPIGSSNQESFFGGRPWETSAPSTNTGTAKSWGTSGPFQNSTSLLSPSSHISDIWSFSLPTFSSDNTTTAPPPSTFRSLDNTPNNISYSRSPNNNSLPSPRYPTSNSQQQQHSSSFSSVSSGTQAFGRSFTSTPPINEEIINNDDYLGEDISTSPSEYDPTNPSEAFNSLSGEHPLGEHPSRTLFVRNINSNLEDEELSQMFEQYGPIRNMYTQCKHRGFVMISYYDIRHAKNAMRYLQGKLLRKRKLDIHYSIPKDNPSERDQNQGTLVVFNLDPSTSNEELKLIFGQFGEIKEIRETPNKKHHKFIEFFDIRDADKAMKNLNKTDIKGKKIKIEPSRPGGRRTPVPPLPNSNSSNTTTSNLVSTSAPPVISHHHHLSHSLDNNNNSTLLNSSSSYSNTSLLHSNNNNNNINNAMFPHSLPDNEDLFHYNSLPNQFNLMSLNKNNSNSSIHNPSNPFQYSSSDLFGSYSSNYSPPYSGTTPTTNNTSKGLVASSSLGNNPTLANNNSSDYIMRNRSQSFSSADRDLMHQSTATTTASNNNNIWSDPFSALSPRGGGFNNGSMNSSSSTTTTTTTSFHKVGGFSPPQHLPPHNNTTTTNTVISTTPPTFSDLLFDNNLRSTSPASKSFDGISEVRSRNRSQSIDEDRSKYILSLDRVRNGGDPRTTLMIKNIPNKYSQKMLLATVDEKHKGTYDFFYLPIDFKNKCNVGYAFINFTNPDYIIPFYEDFNNKKWEKFNSEKVCDIAYARIQGKNALISHFQNSSLMVEDKKCRPIIFHDGEPESFPLNNNTVANVASPRRSRSSSFSSQGSRDEDKA